MPAHAAVAVHNDFASGQSGVPLGTTDDEATGRIDEVFGFLRKQFFRQGLLDHVLNAKFFDGVMVNAGTVLGGNDDVGDGHWFIVHVLH